MNDFLVENIDLHLNSTVGELYLFDDRMDISKIVKEADHQFRRNPILPGILLYDNKKYIGMISRKSFYETFNKPFRYELFTGRSLQFLFENFSHIEWLAIPSTITIVEAVGKALSRNNDNFNDPLLVTYENGSIGILDMYQLILANSKINLLAMKAFKEANDLKTEMLSIASHDLKNPLNAALGLTKLIRGNIEPDRLDTLELIDLVETSLSNMHSLIIELLNSSVIEAGKLELKKQLIDLAELIAAITYQNQPNAAKKGQIIEFVYNKNNEYIIKGDSIKIRESIENLVSNAIKYSSFNSIIEIGLKKIQGFCQVFVKDKGPGFTSDDMSKLFGKFQRLSAQPTNGESSSGLGLYIAKQIVELHEGRIYVNSQNGSGSTFYLEIPEVQL